MQENCSCFTRRGLRHGLRSRQITRRGFYFRSSDSKRIRRYFCSLCRSWPSDARFSHSYGQKRRLLNPLIARDRYSGVSINQSARNLGCNPKTVARKLVFLGRLSKTQNTRALKRFAGQRLHREVIFDEMETSHHTKLKPLSIALAVSPERFILGCEVSVMPAKGPLAELSLKKYGRRPDERGAGLKRLFDSIQPLVSKEVGFKSDECPRYPVALRRHFPGTLHQTYKGRRARSAGLGELKRGGFDPLFSLNHTAAQLRAHVNRLFRKTWCTTKRIDRLEHHLSIMIREHNRKIFRRLGAGPYPRVLPHPRAP